MSTAFANTQSSGEGGSGVKQNARCAFCAGTGWRQYDENHAQVCEHCCKHDKGWWELTEHHAGYVAGADNACCRAGCGTMRRDLPNRKMIHAPNMDTKTQDRSEQPSEHAMRAVEEYWRDPWYASVEAKQELARCIDQHAIAPAVAELQAEVAELEQDKARLESEVLDAIEDAARGACHTAKQEREHNGIAAGSLITDSGAISSNAENLRRLAEAKRFRIVSAFGRMVVGFWPENDPNRSKERT